MKNVTITLDDELLARARIEAARQSKSLSRFVADLVADRCGARDDPAAALKKYLSGPGFTSVGVGLPTREEIYAERTKELFRRYESAHLRGGSGGAGETADGRGVAPEDDQGPHAGSESAKSK
jgi:hypothetical protein